MYFFTQNRGGMLNPVDYEVNEELFEAVHLYHSLIKDYLEKQSKNVCIHFKKTIIL